MVILTIYVCLWDFITDGIDNSNISKSIITYAKVLSERIWNTENSQDAFAIGVAGTWGSGKQEMKKQTSKPKSKSKLLKGGKYVAQSKSK